MTPYSERRQLTENFVFIEIIESYLTDNLFMIGCLLNNPSIQLQALSSVNCKCSLLRDHSCIVFLRIKRQRKGAIVYGQPVRSRIFFGSVPNLVG